MHTVSGEPSKAHVEIDNEDSLRNSELVLELVMSYLPIEDCVRTSILSSKWRYRWTTTPRLVFDTTCCPRPHRFDMEEGRKSLSNIINCVLSQHNGSIQVFKFSGPCAALDIDCWIFRLSKDSVKTLVLDLWDTVQYMLPSSLFTYGNLSSLKLGNCLLRPSSSFKGFKNLKFLELKFVTLTNDALEKMISSCPLLEKLILFGLKEANILTINAPNLQHIDIFCDFVSVTFGSPMTRPSVIYIQAPKCGYTSLLDFFIKLPNIQRLEINCSNMEYMYGDSIVGGFPFGCKDLYRLAINMDFSFNGYADPILYLYRSSSNLTEQLIELWDDSYLAIELCEWEDNSKCDNQFERLQRVNVHDFCGKREELKFVEFVLRTSPVLETMSVNTRLNPHLVPYSDEVKWKVVRNIYRFKRASDQAKIIIDGLATQVS